MKGDFSRTTFDRRRRYSSVLMQQGRVVQDADWNEQAAIVLHHLRTLAADLIGPHGGPGESFRITCDQELERDFVIAPGRYYVDGILAENLPRDGWSGGPRVTYCDQPDHSGPAKLEPGTDYLVYLDVWERHITSVEAPGLRETALGGSDTSTRQQTVWQVDVLNEAGHVPDPAHERTCEELLRAWVKEREPTGRLRARAQPQSPSNRQDTVPHRSGYRGSENRLYRVEIHDGGQAGVGDESATFKWSRDNGSIVFPIQELQGGIATLDGRLPAQRLAPRAGDRVEVVDDRSVLGSAPGVMAVVESVDPVRAEVSLGFLGARADPPRYDRNTTVHPLLRRWDQEADVVPVTEAEWLDLEDGVQIRFEPSGVYRTGDHWSIPTRSITGEVVWPSDEQTDDAGSPSALLSHGVEHHYAPLARIRVDGSGSVTRVEDCRCVIEPLSGPRGGAKV